MLTLGHLAGGYIAAYIVLSMINPSLSASETNILLLIGAFVGAMPDLDAFVFFYKTKKANYKEKSHRYYVTHAPIVWILIGLSVFLLSDDEIFKIVGLILLFGSLSHFILDSMGRGIMWIWPFSKDMYRIGKMPKQNFSYKKGAVEYFLKFVPRIYFKSPTFYLEIFVVIVAILIWAFR